jgi:hypothetical protein
MNAILQFVQEHKILVALVGGCIVGLLIGLLFGWVLWPVEYYNATPSHLRPDFQEDYLLWVAEQYERDGDQESARERLGVEFWEKEELARKLDELAETHPGTEAIHLRALASMLDTAPAVTSEEEPATQGGLWTSVFRVCGSALLVVACVGGIIYFFSRVRARQAAPSAAKQRLGMARERAPSEGVTWGIGGAPLVQFVTSYVLGDDHYDPSFSIELENGEFMGECGVGISETIGVGAPNKITAFEIWLFDKSDIRTVTKVLMSDYAYNDEAFRAKLAPKGEPMLAQKGKELTLETKTLRVRARVTELEYGVGDVPSNSFFEKLSVDLAVWILPQQERIQTVADFELPSAL